MIGLEKTIEERFYDKIKINKENGCHEWQASISRRGYGQFALNSTTQVSHRVAWLLSYGQIPKGIYVLHHCGNPKCVNPAHLFLGTQRDNMNEAISKNIYFRSSGNAKITEKQVIRVKGMLQDGIYSVATIAKRFDVSWHAIYDIKHNRTWKHLQ